MITGTLINIGAVILGGTFGLVFRSRLPERYTSNFFQAIGLFTLFLGFSMSLKTSNPLLLVFSLILGALVGTMLRLQERTENLGTLIQKKFKLKGGRFSEGLVTSFLMFCMGSMTILGAIEEGLGNDPNLLLIKSLMDGFSSVALAAALGAGVIFSVVPLLLYQGGITLLASWFGHSVSNLMIDELTATGGILLIGLGITILGLRKIEVLNLIPALLFIVPLVYFFA
ncbi:MAG TPA: DUF554 domain-containing protein [Tenuifilaceae bacterium]|nr:DUF554 domain-containing protein [Tenuifilaceae bacterium]HPE17984.1 DUF554 domain-containing protein [Tenuifilaceae bacterium]HPJ44896.1 DUF554 domain-containing protein [Tenuifilaceae bacterium]HPQ33138.1 DUF554 domain-containing protein [Tenuifilaceae bacterium]HRX67071.1 DUF554 domain-containing protein [Tenuifilaceae bacterium]